MSETCWVHGEQPRYSCQGCIQNFEIDRDQAAIDEMESEFA